MTSGHTLRYCAGCVLFVLALQARVAAADTIALKWAALPSALAGRRVEVKTSAGKTLKGIILAGDDGSLQFQTGNSTQLLDRRHIARLRILKETYKGRTIGMSAGALFTLPSAAIGDGSAGEKAAGAGIMLGVGYLFGYLADRGAATEVIILP